MKCAAENDSRAAAKFLELAFPAEYRRADPRVKVDTKAQADEVQIVCMPEQRRALVKACAYRAANQNGYHILHLRVRAPAMLYRER